ncbi:MAG: hypothetical protein ABI193_02555 [Minicystis sp.]
MSDFYSGISVLMVLAGQAPAILGREAMLEYFAAFEAAYGPLAELQAAGQLQTGGVMLSAETRESIARLGTLLRLPPTSTEAEREAPEILSLAKHCLKALAPDMPVAA